jgi:pyruvate formate lyase activating enzyme
LFFSVKNGRKMKQVFQKKGRSQTGVWERETRMSIQNKFSVNRRRFIQTGAGAAAGMLVSPVFAKPDAQLNWDAEARYYEKLPKGRVKCHLCPWECTVAPGDRGICEVRANRDGIYHSLVYGRVATSHVDPIEKKPFYHFLPASSAFSIATAGCNVECKFCQNWELAQRKPEELNPVSITPKKLAETAASAGCTSIAYTYNEPTIFTEFMIDTASEARSLGIRSVAVSNGFINPDPLRDLCKVIDAYKVDLKSFRESYYSDIVSGQLAPVLRTLEILKEERVWTEIVYLLVPTLNDSDAEIRDMTQWVFQTLGPDVPVHFSRFYPQYKLKNLPPPPTSTLEKARQIGLDSGLHYVYLGNLPGHEGENTRCPACGEMVIGRTGYQIRAAALSNGQCRKCGQSIAGVWK